MNYVRVQCRRLCVPVLGCNYSQFVLFVFLSSSLADDLFAGTVIVVLSAGLYHSGWERDPRVGAYLSCGHSCTIKGALPLQPLKFTGQRLQEQLAVGSLVCVVMDEKEL